MTARVLLINGHQPYEVSPGRLNAAFAERAVRFFSQRRFELHRMSLTDGWHIEEEIERQLWADVVILQFPVNSMGPPWLLKKYLDEVYTAGMDGRLSSGDGRSRKDAARQYGTGGTMSGTSYMLSVTLNAPRHAFDDPAQTFFEGGSIDDLLRPLHLNFRFFGLKPLPTFAAYDVSKNPEIEQDFARFAAHLAAAFDGSC